MAKLTKKEKIALQSNNNQKNIDKSTTYLNRIRLSTIIKKNWYVFFGLAILCFAVYFNSLNNELTLVDDVQGIVYDESIKDLKNTLAKHNIQKIVYAVSYHFFDYEPFPLRLVSVSLHTLITLLAFLIVYLLFDRKTAIIASLVFATHPLNTEAVTWISGAPYLYIAFFTYLVTLFFVLYKRDTQKIVYLFLSLLSYLLMIYLQSSPWILIVPMVLVIIDQFIIEKKHNFKKVAWLLLFLIPVVVYMITKFGALYQVRTEMRSGTNGERVTLHTQALTPVIQGYPYTTHLMAKLYLLPTNLSVYYDGMQVTPLLLLSMYITFLLYVSLVIYLWNKNKRLFGIFILFPFLIAPAYSPIKITWFLAERYLYAGTAFFGVLVAYLFNYLETRTKKKVIIYCAFLILLALYIVKTIMRNNDWQNTKTLSLANMKASPLSVRPYNDMGGYYYNMGDVDTAVHWYEKGLQVLSTSGTAINNLGYIYLEAGPLIFRHDFVQPEQNPQEAQKFFEYAVQLSNSGGDARTMSYFVNKAYALNMSSEDLGIALANFYLELGLNDYALQLFEHVLKMYPENQNALFRVELLRSQLE